MNYLLFKHDAVIGFKDTEDCPIYDKDNDNKNWRVRGPEYPIYSNPTTGESIYGTEHWHCRFDQFIPPLDNRPLGVTQSFKDTHVLIHNARDAQDWESWNFCRQDLVKGVIEMRNELHSLMETIPLMLKNADALLPLIDGTDEFNVPAVKSAMACFNDVVCRHIMPGDESYLFHTSQSRHETIQCCTCKANVFVDDLRERGVNIPAAPNAVRFYCYPECAENTYDVKVTYNGDARMINIQRGHTVGSFLQTSFDNYHDGMILKRGKTEYSTETLMDDLCIAKSTAPKNMRFRQFKIVETIVTKGKKRCREPEEEENRPTKQTKPVEEPEEEEPEDDMSISSMESFDSEVDEVVEAFDFSNITPVEPLENWACVDRMWGSKGKLSNFRYNMAAVHDGNFTLQRIPVKARDAYLRLPIELQLTEITWSPFTSVCEATGEEWCLVHFNVDRDHLLKHQIARNHVKETANHEFPKGKKMGTDSGVRVLSALASLAIDLLSQENVEFTGLIDPAAILCNYDDLKDVSILPCDNIIITGPRRSPVRSNCEQLQILMQGCHEKVSVKWPKRELKKRLRNGDNPSLSSIMSFGKPKFIIQYAERCIDCASTYLEYEPFVISTKGRSALKTSGKGKTPARAFKSPYMGRAGKTIYQQKYSANEEEEEEEEEEEL
jgi:hypothetical protein